MDVLFYSNYCKHSSQLLQFLSKHGIAAKLNCVCVDRRMRDPTNGQIMILTENGKRIHLPVNVHNVPSLLLVSQKYKVLVGDEIYSLFENVVKNNKNIATQGNGEPLGYVLGASGGSGNSSFGESYDDSPNVGPMINVVSAQHNNLFQIETPPDTYTSNKIGSDTTLDLLQQKRNAELSPAPYLGDISSRSMYGSI